MSEATASDLREVAEFLDDLDAVGAQRARSAATLIEQQAAKIARLESRGIEDMKFTIEQQAARIAGLEEEMARHAAAVMAYGAHLDDCSRPGGGVCSCGFAFEINAAAGITTQEAADGQAE